LPIPYFLDDCSEWELNDLVELIPYCDRSTWEQSRMNAYIMAQVNSKKKLEPKDIVSFKWDDNNGMEVEHQTSITNEDIERLKRLSERWER
jgi:hypothetical protein